MPSQATSRRRCASRARSSRGRATAAEQLQTGGVRSRPPAHRGVGLLDHQRLPAPRQQPSRPEPGRRLRESAARPERRRPSTRCTPPPSRVGRACGSRAAPTSPARSNTFGGTSTAEYGGLLLSNYPAPGFTITQRYNNFQNNVLGNPCPAPGATASNRLTSQRGRLDGGPAVLFLVFRAAEEVAAARVSPSVGTTIRRTFDQWSRQLRRNLGQSMRPPPLSTAITCTK